VLSRRPGLSLSPAGQVAADRDLDSDSESPGHWQAPASHGDGPHMRRPGSATRRQVTAPGRPGATDNCLSLTGSGRQLSSELES
jgi:hypothetical protein